MNASIKPQASTRAKLLVVVPGHRGAPVEEIAEQLRRHPGQVVVGCEAPDLTPGATTLVVVDAARRPQELRWTPPDM